jgi:hypothetical protein
MTIETLLGLWLGVYCLDLVHNVYRCQSQAPKPTFYGESDYDYRKLVRVVVRFYCPDLVHRVYRCQSQAPRPTFYGESDYDYGNFVRVVVRRLLSRFST